MNNKFKLLVTAIALLGIIGQLSSCGGGGGGGGGAQTMELITINTTTGAITSVGTSVDNLSAIAFGN